MKIGFVGGTGPAGIGLAARLGRSGHAAVLGSRSVERAAEAAAKVQALVPGASVSSAVNEDAVRDAEVVFLTVRDDAQRETVRSLSPLLAGKIVVSMANPLRVEKGAAVYLHPPEGSLAEEVQRDAPEARVVSGFHEVKVTKFAKLDLDLDADTILCGDDDDAKKVVAALAEELPLRPVDAGPLRNSRYVEAFVAVLITINLRYRASASYRITGLPQA